MRLLHRSVAAIFCAAALLTEPVMAQERELLFSLTGGASAAPSYFGADSYSVSPSGNIGFTGLRFGTVQFGDLDGPTQFPSGTGLRGAFRYISEREGKDELAGLSDVDASLELGMRLHHTSEFWQAYGELRYGIIGHKALAGEIGVNVIYRDSTGLVLHAGPRAEFGNARFVRTYFGITATEAAQSGLTAYRPNGGMHSVGFETGAYKPLGADWGITGSVRYDRLRGSAADSPIVLQGSRNQFSATLG